MKILVFGDLNLDIFFRLDLDYIELRDLSYISDKCVAIPGGSAGNVAVSLKRLGEYPYIVSAVGSDIFAKTVIDNLIEEGISIEGIRTVESETTGIMVIILRKGGKRTIIGYRGANTHNVISVEESSEMMSNTEYTYISGFTRHNIDSGRSIERLIKSSIESNIHIGLDLGGMDREFLYESLSKYRGSYTDIFLNLDELRSFFGRNLKESLEMLHSLLLPNAIFLKMGSKGSIVYRNGKLYRVRSVPVENVVDTTGCGDAFNAGAIVGLKMGLDPQERAVLGNLMGAYKAQGMGTKHLPKSLEELKEFAKRYVNLSSIFHV